MSDDLKAAVSAALAEAGISAPTETPAAPTEAPAPAPAIDYDALANAIVSRQAAAKPAPETAPKPAPETAPANFADLLAAMAQPDAPTYESPGAPSAPRAPDLTPNPIHWTQDDISRMKADGTFLQNVEKWADTLPGARGGLFRKRIPKGS